MMIMATSCSGFVTPGISSVGGKNGLVLGRLSRHRAQRTCPASASQATGISMAAREPPTFVILPGFGNADVDYGEVGIPRSNHAA